MMKLLNDMSVIKVGRNRKARATEGFDEKDVTDRIFC